MPVTPSARKALRNAQAKRARNVETKLQLKRLLKNASVETLSKVVSFVDKAAKRDIIHPNKAARIKSQLSKLSAGTAPVKTATKRTSTAKRTAVKAKAKAARATARTPKAARPASAARSKKK